MSVSSLKALYFAHVPAAVDKYVSASSAYKRYTQNYQLSVGSVAIPTTPVQVQALGNVTGEGTYTKAMAELLRAWHIRLNDTDMETLLQPGQTWDEYTAAKNSRINFYMGVELESFSNKDDTIESGANVLNNNVELRINYKSDAATNVYNLVFFALHDIFIVIDPRRLASPLWNFKNAQKRPKIYEKNKSSKNIFRCGHQLQGNLESSSSNFGICVTSQNVPRMFLQVVQNTGI